MAALPALPPMRLPLPCGDTDVADTGTVALDHLPLVAGHFLEVAISVSTRKVIHWRLVFGGGLGVHAAGLFRPGRWQECDCAFSLSILCSSCLCNEAHGVVVPFP